MSGATIGKIEPRPANKGAIIGYLITSLIFLGIGVLCFILLLGIEVGSPPETIGTIITNSLDDLMVLIAGVGATIAQYWWIVLLIVVGLTILGFLVGWLLLVLVAKLGHILVYIGCAMYIVGAIIGVILLPIFGFGFIGAIGPLVPAAFLIIGMIVNFRKFKRAGEFMKFTGQVILAEKGMILAPLFVTGISIINFLTMGSIFAFLALTFQESIVWLGYVLGSLASLLQLVVYFGMFYIAEGINTTYAYEWYRKRDPDMKFCVRNVAGLFGPIFAFGVATAFVSWLQQMLRNAASSSSNNLPGLIFAIFARIVAALLGFIYKYLTYFTLPAIVVEGRKFKDGVVRSFDLLKRYYMDVLIRETGVSRGMSFVQMISTLIYAIIGVIVGLILKGVMQDDISWTAAILIPVIPMIIFGNIPTFFIFRPMKTAYLTFIFAYAQDEEKNFSLPSRMPAELRGDIKEAEKGLDPKKSIAYIKL